MIDSVLSSNIVISSKNPKDLKKLLELEINRKNFNRSKSEIYIGDDEISESINEDILPNLNKFDAGILAGFGVQGRFNSAMDIFLEFRYTQGFINLDNESADLRYNFNYDSFWPEVEFDKPKLKAFMLTTGFIVYLDPR